MTVAAGLESVRERIRHAATAVGRDPAEVRLVAVSKKKPASAIREAYAAGQRDFGENYAQELVDKAAELADLVDLRWHFIGHLQSNKARVVARVAHVVHTVDGALRSVHREPQRSPRR
jgi:pyridoxal phosphate enzyme (YggS family)